MSSGAHLVDAGGEPPWLAGATVAVVGLGLMGGSLAGALTGRDGRPRRCTRVIGIVHSPSAREAALRWVDSATADLAAVADADLVVLATPVRRILALLPEVAARMRPGALLTDLGSTKGAIVAAMAALPREILAIGGHPMCGKEGGGLAAADPRLYESAPFVFCPVPGQPIEALAHATALARALGAHPRVLDAAAHDRAVAAISHAPYAAAVALVRAAEQAAAGGDEPWALAAGGFRDTTRVAAGEMDMWVDILLTNAGPVLEQLAWLRADLDALAAAVSAGDEAALRALIGPARRRRRTLFA